MFDLSLLRKPTFVGGLVAAVGVSASVFSLLTYLVIYVQNVLGFSAVQSGLRFLFLSGCRSSPRSSPAGSPPRPDEVADRTRLLRRRPRPVPARRDLRAATPSGPHLIPG